mmetsp:Transcript_22929/g.53660  ORF Transcript_22929/g.53660 Transcript_22929/m.53660 type:complete len:191 (+) Transcript_22929:50-622(+)
MGNNCCVQEEDAPGTIHQVAPSEQERQFAGFSDSFAPDAVPSPAVSRTSQTMLQQEAFDVITSEPSKPSIAMASPVPVLQQEEPQPDAAKQLAEKSLEEQTGELTVTICKTNLEEKLGVDLKHCEGYVLVKNIFEGFAAAQHADTGKESLKLGDKIVKINDVEGDTDRMVAACKDSLVITFSVVREQAAH